LYSCAKLDLLKCRIRNAANGEETSYDVFENRVLRRMVLLGKPKGKRPLGRPRLRWVDNIRMDLQEVGCGYVDWIGLAQDRNWWRKIVSTVINLRVP